MGTYRVDWWESHSLEVEADNEDEAMEIAMGNKQNTIIEIPLDKVIIEEVGK
jgi:hypothetical protein